MGTPGRVIPPEGLPRLLAGPPLEAGPESWGAHTARLGPLPRLDSRAATEQLLSELERGGLRGRGGAGFPVARKWRSVAAGRGRPVIVVNAAEGEPAGLKDETLLASRPHLILDGAEVAARALQAREVIVYLRQDMTRAWRPVEQALVERPRDTISFGLVAAPTAYVAGQETAAVNILNGGPAKPTFVPPRPFERGVGRKPTLVQNAETLASVALLARYGSHWFRSIGERPDYGSALIAVWGGERYEGILESRLGAPLRELELMCDGVEREGAVLLGGYGGVWASRRESQALPLGYNPPTLGAGVMVWLPRAECGVAATARIVAFLARESAGQCGPCVFGLQDLAHELHGLAFAGGSQAGSVERLSRWADQLTGRGACAHPSGAAQLVKSALHVFGPELRLHERGGCSGSVTQTVLPGLGGPSRAHLLRAG